MYSCIDTFYDTTAFYVQLSTVVLGLRRLSTYSYHRATVPIPDAIRIGSRGGNAIVTSFTGLRSKLGRSVLLLIIRSIHQEIEDALLVFGDFIFSVIHFGLNCRQFILCRFEH
jgi:hypothetical protein